MLPCTRGSRTPRPIPAVLTALTAAALLPLVVLPAQASAETARTGVVERAVVGDALPADADTRYIVTLRQGHGGRFVGGEYGRRGAKIRHTYSRALQGFAAELTEDQLAHVRADKRVAFVEPDREVTGAQTQLSPPAWGLDRLDQTSLPLSKSYTYEATGRGVVAYVLDTGVRSTHAEFAGRVGTGFDAVAGTSTEDCHGHGTHIAGTIGGTSSGVAKAVTIVPVRVLRCDLSGSWSDVLAGVDWVTGHHQAGTPAVVNMSIGGGSSAAVDTAVQASIADGVFYAAAAGNQGADACGYSPARVPEVFTVGATDELDARPTYSNTGSCLDLFAPGSGISSAGITSDSATTVKSGTSMAAPHAAGAAAMWLETRPTATPATVAQALLGGATAGIVGASGTGSPNLLLKVLPASTTSSPPAPPPVVTTPAAIQLAASGYKVKGLQYASVTWSGVTGSSVDVLRNGRVIATTVNDGAHVDRIGVKGSGTFVYQLCEPSTGVCSPTVLVTF